MKRKQGEVEEEELPVVVADRSLTNFSHYLVDSQTSCFRYITTQAQHFATMFACLSSIGDSIRLVISKEGITGTCMNAPHTVIARYSLDAQKLVEGMFVPPRETLEVVVGLSQLANVLDANRKSESICVSVDNDTCPDRLHVASIEDETTGFSTLTLQNPEKPLTVPPISYSNRVVLQTALLNNRLHSRTDSKTVAFIVDATLNKFTVEFKNFLGELICFSWPLEENHNTTSIRSVFNLSTMVNIFRISKATKDVSISMSEPYDNAAGQSMLKPLCLNFIVSAIGELTFFVSPIDEDDE